MSDGAPQFGGLRISPSAPATATSAAAPALVRHARKDSRTIAVLRLAERSDGCVVTAEVFPVGAPDGPPVLRPYAFADRRRALAFVDEAVEALTYLGCDVGDE